MRRIVVLAVAGLVVLVLVVGQLVLPGIAAQRLRDKLSGSGQVLSVEVHAFPAIELLWHDADRVVIRMASYRSDSGRLGSFLGQAGGVGSIDASAGEVDIGLLKLHDAQLRKRGGTLTGSARVTEDDLRAAAPFLQSLQPIASGNGRLTLRGTASLFGVSATVDATVAAHDGALVVQPDVPLGALATVTAFSDPRIEVESVGATSGPGGFTVTARARLT